MSRGRGLLWPLHRWLEAGNLLLFRIELQRFAAAAVRRDVVGGWVGAESLRDLLLVCDPPSSGTAWRARARLLEERLSRGARPYLLRDAATLRPLHVRWSTDQPEVLPECGLWLCPDVAETYFFDAFTVPDARGRGLSGHVRRLMAAELRREGVRRAFWYVLDRNLPSLRSVPREAVQAQAVPFLRMGPPARPWLAAALRRPQAPLQPDPGDYSMQGLRSTPWTAPAVGSVTSR
jgi:hypothetical protein